MHAGWKAASTTTRCPSTSASSWTATAAGRRPSGGTTEQGHQAGADKIQELLGWCAETDVEVVTLWLLSTDNLDRPDDELVPLLGIIEDTVRDLAADGRWRVHHVGTLDLLPDRTQ